MASIVHGEARLTNDLDLVIEMKEAHVSSLVTALTEEFYVDEHAMRQALRERSSFNLIYLDGPIAAVRPTISSVSLPLIIAPPCHRPVAVGELDLLGFAYFCPTKPRNRGIRRALGQGLLWKCRCSFV